MTLLAGLIILAFVLFFFEIFLPGGILAIAGGILLLAASGLAWVELGPIWGILLLIGGVLGALLLFFLEIKFISGTRFGNQIRLQTAITSSVHAVPDEDLVGKDGVALTTLAPSGKVQINGRTHVAAAQEGFIQRGVAISVLRTSAFKLIVTKK